jgi:hypothetical protein
MNTDTDTTGCAHDLCQCSLKNGEGIKIDGELYCSEECARGEGCFHADCNCGNA